MAKESYTTHQAAGYCDVEPNTIVNWINAGKLPAYKTPGGHRRIKKENLIAFLKENNMPVPAALEKNGLKKILIVEDDSIIVRTIKRTLQRAKFKCEIASAPDGFEAGKQVLAFHPDLVILDLKLPGIDGFKVCENIRTDEATGNIKILAVTGYDTPANKRRIFKCGADDYLAKPFEAADLIKKIDNLLR